MTDAVRILHMIGSLNTGGSQRMALNLLKAVDRRQIQFDFVIDRPDQRALAPEAEALGARIFAMPSFHGTNVREIRRVWDEFFTRHTEYPILHTHVRSYASLFLPIAKKHGLLTVAHSHNTSNGAGIAACAKNVMQLPLRRQADELLACSRGAGEWLFGKRAVDSGKCHIFPNAIDTALYRFSPSVRHDVRQAFGLEDKWVMGHIGRFSPQKNHGFLIDVFAATVLRMPNAVLLLAGNNESDSRTLRTVRQKIDRLGFADRVIFTGVRSDVDRLLQGMDVFVMPSRYEGLGMAAIEAQAAGLPCFLSDRIPEEAFFSELAHKLPLTDNAELWADAILSSDSARKDVSPLLAECGYDVGIAAAWLTDFYRKMISGTKIS